MGVERVEQAKQTITPPAPALAGGRTFEGPVDAGRLTPQAVLALQCSAGNRAVSSLVGRRPADRRLQRTIVVAGAGGEVDLGRVLAGYGVTGATGIRLWFAKEIVPRLDKLHFGYPRFAGYLFGGKAEYTIKVEAGGPIDKLSYTALNDAVALALKTKVWSEKFEKGHGTIGKVQLLSRGNFPAAVKKSFAKADVMKETDLAAKQVHLRHFVMGSWFRSLPNVFLRAKLQPSEESELAKRVAGLVVGLGPYSQAKSAQASGKLNDDVGVLAMILHNLVPNLNAGEGAENTLIGFLSHGFSDLAIDFENMNTSIARDEVELLVQTAIDAVGLVDKDARANWIQEFDPVGVFEAMLAARVGPTDPPPSHELAAVMHEFAFALGIDFMKRRSGLATEIQALPKQNVIADLQATFIPVGDRVYSLIVESNARIVDANDLSKLLNELEAALKKLTAVYTPNQK